jgi:hypothetical protein
MEIFISYRDSAGAAEMEFRRLFAKLEHGESFRLPYINADALGWSRLLPGLVCDLTPEGATEKAPAIFMGMLGEQSMLSCMLQTSDASSTRPNLSRILRRRDNIRQASFSQLSDRLDFLSEVVDGTVSILDLPVVQGPYDSLGAQRRDPFAGFSDMSGSHFRFPNFDVLEQEAVEIGQEPVKYRIAELLALLTNISNEKHVDQVLGKLVQDHHCRFAWASIQAEDPAPPQFTYAWNTFCPVDRLRGPLSRDKGNMGDFRSFWEKRTLLMQPLSFSRSFLEGGTRLSWPYWLQFLVLISSVGRRTLRKYKLPRLVRFRRSHKGARKTQQEASRSREGVGLETFAELYRGGDEGHTAGSELQGRKLRSRRHNRILQRIERALILPDADTVYSLFRGDVAPERPLKKRTRMED